MDSPPLPLPSLTEKEAPLTCSEFTPEGTNGEGDAVTLLRRLGGVRLRCRDAGENQLPPSTKRRKTGGGDRRSCETQPPPTLAVVAPLSTRACCDERRTLPCSKLPPSSVALPLQEKAPLGNSSHRVKCEESAPPFSSAQAVEVFVEKSGRETSRSCSRQPSPVAEPPEAEESTHAAAAIFTLQRRRVLRRSRTVATSRRWTHRLCRYLR
nr:hypothetical protein Iba_chr15cCG6510 [Ipomoea batatas]